MREIVCEGDGVGGRWCSNEEGKYTSSNTYPSLNGCCWRYH